MSDKPLDFYSICAHYWGMDRCDAKSQLICWYFTKVTRDMNDSMQFGPQLLDYIPAEARTEVLAYQGIVVGNE